METYSNNLQKTSVGELIGSEKFIYTSYKKFFIQSGLSEQEAEQKSFDKIQSVRRLKKHKGILKR